MTDLSRLFSGDMAVDALVRELPKMTYGEAVFDNAVSEIGNAIQSLDDFLLDVTTRKTVREPTMMDRLVAEQLREEGPTRRWFLKAGLSIGAIAFMSAFPGAPVNAAGTTFFAATTGDNSDGTTWAKAKTTITGGISVCGAGDYLLVDSTYSVSAAAAVTWTCPAGGLAIISVTVSGASGFSAFTAGAVESVGAAAAAFSINKAATSNFFIYGITGNGGTNVSASCDINLFSNATNANSFLYLSSCTLDVKAASTSAQLNIGQSGTSFGEQSTKVTALNCTFICSGSRAGTLSLLGSKLFLELINPTFSMTGGTKPAILFDMGLVGDEAVVVIRDGDISGYNVSSGAYFNVANFASTRVTIQNCKTSSTPALTTGTWSANGTGNLLVLNADSANTLYVFHYDNAYGTLDAETTDFVTTGGAHFNGSPIAWKVVTKSTASEFAPFILPPLVIWNTTTTAQTSAIEIAQVNGAAALTDRQIWSDLDYPASASFPNGSWQSNRSGQPFVGTGVAHATSTNPWTVPNIGASPVTQKLQSGTATTPATFTAAAVGPIQSKISIGVATLTLWINPNIDGIT